MRKRQTEKIAKEKATLPVLRMGQEKTLGKAIKRVEARIGDIRDILQQYIVDDISEGLRKGLLDAERLGNFSKYEKTYQDLFLLNVEAGEKEVGYELEDVALTIGVDFQELKKKLRTGLFPQPRLLLSNRYPGYSLMQVAVIVDGDASVLLQGDDTFLWYQFVANILEIDLVAALKRKKTAQWTWPILSEQASGAAK